MMPSIMKEKKEKTSSPNRLKTLKILAVIPGFAILLYLLMLLFAPHLLQRMGTALRNRFGAGKARAVSFATAEKGGHYYRLGNLIKDEMSTRFNRDVDVRVTGGTLENLELLRKGETDVALVQGALPEDEASSYRGLAAIAVIGRQYVHILVPQSSPVSSFRDLAGKRVSLGLEKSGNAALGWLVFDYFPPSSAVQLTYTSIETVEADFQADRMDALFTVYDLNAPVIKTLMDTGRYRLVPIPEAEAIAYGLPGCFSGTLPYGIYGPDRGIPSPGAGGFPTLKVNTLLVTRKEVKGYVIHNLLRVIFSPRFVKKSGLPMLDETAGRRVFDLPLHAAADRFYRRNDPVTADKYEIGSALIAALLFLATVVGYFINRYRARVRAQKKRNIVPYFEELLDYGRQMARTEDIQGLKDLLDHMMAMQRKAEKEWLAGNLDTEHMENLYAIYGIRCENVFNKMTLLQLIKNQSLLEELRALPSSDGAPPA